VLGWALFVVVATNGNIPNLCVDGGGMRDVANDRDFLEAYNTGGLASAYYACIVVSVVYAAFAGAAIWSGSWTFEELYVRGAIVGILASLAWFLRLFPELSIRYYQNGLFAVSFLVLLATVYLVFAGGVSARYSLLGAASTIIFGLFLHYAFLRLTIFRSVAVGLCVSGLFFMGLFREEVDGESYARVAIYLIACNVAGFLLRRAVIQRERALFRVRVRMRQAESLSSARAMRAESEFLERVRLMNAIDHDLRQPLFAADVHLRSVVGFVTSLGASEAVESARELERVLGVVRRTLDHVKGLSAVDRIGGRLSSESVFVATIFEGLRAVLEAEAKRAGVRLLLCPSEWNINVLSNAGALSQIVLNLVVNGIKYSALSRGANAVVGVRVRVRGGVAQVRVWDNGGGIAKVDRKSVWAAYSRSRESEISLRVDGLGLGLFLVGRMIELLPAHRIALRSKVGVGTIFRLCLPVCISAFMVEGDGQDISGAYVLFISGEGDRQLDGWLEGLERHGVLVDVYSSLDAIPSDALEDRPVDLLVAFGNSVNASRFSEFVRVSVACHGRPPVLMADSSFVGHVDGVEVVPFSGTLTVVELQDVVRTAVSRARIYEASSQ
jgi:signal transduction histidine kinase